jgi:hypothetical protein
VGCGSIIATITLMIICGYSCVIFNRARSSLKRFKMMRYSAKFAGVFYQSSSHIKKALFCLRQGLQSLYYNRDEIRNLLILYITNAIAWVSVYNNYLPTPVKVVWVVLSSYYRRAFVVADDASHKNQAASS